MMTDGDTIRTRNSIFWATLSEPDDRRIAGANTSSTSVPESAMPRPKRSDSVFATGSLVAALISGSTIWRGCSIPSLLFEPMPRALGDGEIQTPETASTAGRALGPEGFLTRSQTLCPLVDAGGPRLDGKSRMSGDVHVRIR